MSGGVSPGTGRRYPLTMVCAVFRVARSTVYATPAARPNVTLGKRGPKTATSDAELRLPLHAPALWEFQHLCRRRFTARSRGRLPRLVLHARPPWLPSS
jgi:hypothetical protein